MDLRFRPTQSMVRAGFIFCAAVMLASCEEPPAKVANPDEAKMADAGFEAVISGAYDGTVSGSGVLVLLANAGANKKGYLFLADGQGIRPHGITFVLPRGLAPGKHRLTSPSAFEIESVPSVRVDRDLNNATVSAQRNTSGYLELSAYPEDDRNLAGAQVSGRFEFQTEDAKGGTLQVTGSFSFKVK